MFNKLKRWIQSTIGLSSSEANAMMILMPALFLIIFSEPLYRWFARPASPIQVKEERFLDSLVISLEATVDSSATNIVSRFIFDPNTSTLEEFKKLGIPESVGRRIVQYRNKGGQFRIKSDLSKIYGLDSLLYKSLVPYILLPDQIEKKIFPKEERPKVAIQYDLNLTDTISLKSVKGIGSALSARIIKYRESLGGFVKAVQVGEVYGLDSLVLSELKPFYVADDFQPRKIKVNEVTEQELDRHPYLSLKEAKSIITYRLQHGKYASIEDLLKIKSIKESTVIKVGPYLSFE
jgi:DNA uptake protein ComE-like DNA-binding protein